MYGDNSIFSVLGKNIASSMKLGIYASAKITSTGNINYSIQNKQNKIGKNTNIICGQFICEDDADNEFYCQ